MAVTFFSGRNPAASTAGYFSIGRHSVENKKKQRDARITCDKNRGRNNRTLFIPLKLISLLWRKRAPTERNARWIRIAVLLHLDWLQQVVVVREFRLGLLPRAVLREHSMSKNECAEGLLRGEGVACAWGGGTLTKNRHIQLGNSA